jgi:hypothetical protein
MRGTGPDHLILLDMMILIIFSEESSGPKKRVLFAFLCYFTILEFWLSQNCRRICREYSVLAVFNQSVCPKRQRFWLQFGTFPVLTSALLTQVFVPIGKYRARTWPLPFTSSPVHHSLIILLYNAILITGFAKLTEHRCHIWQFSEVQGHETDMNLVI